MSFVIIINTERFSKLSNELTSGDITSSPHFLIFSQQIAVTWKTLLRLKSETYMNQSNRSLCNQPLGTWGKWKWLETVARSHSFLCRSSLVNPGAQTAPSPPPPPPPPPPPLPLLLLCQTLPPVLLLLLFLCLPLMAQGEVVLPCWAPSRPSARANWKKAETTARSKPVTWPCPPPPPQPLQPVLHLQTIITATWRPTGSASWSGSCRCSQRCENESKSHF